MAPPAEPMDLHEARPQLTRRPPSLRGLGPLGRQQRHPIGEYGRVLHGTPPVLTNRHVYYALGLWTLQATIERSDIAY